MNMNIMNTNNMNLKMNSMNNLNMNNMNANNMKNNNSNPSMNDNKNNNLNQSNFSSYPHKKGLVNVGQSCYMNATIQCLSNIEELSNYLLKRYGIFNVENQPLTTAYSSLIFKLFHTEEKYISPNLFKEIIGLLNPLFKGNHAADAKDLVFFIIEKLHQELNENSLNQQSNFQLNFAQQEEMSKNQENMFKLFINDFNSKNNSIVSKTFYGINRSIMKCNSCNTTKYSFQTFNLLIFQLRKVKEEMEKSLGEYYQKLELMDAFNVEKREEILDGENMIYCNQCQKLSPGSHQQEIYQLPSVLIIILNRGKNNQDFNEEFELPLELDFTNQNIVINNQSYMKYYLCSVITHLGESGKEGHFVAYCRNSPESQFYFYNDATVTPVKDNNSAIETKISKRDSEKKTPYILFYHHLPK